MEKNNKVEKVVKLNLNYLVFIKDLISSKLIVEKSNKDKIMELYSEKVNLRFNNINRVDSRVKRKENKEKLLNFLKENKIELKEFNKVSEKVVEIRKNKSLNYI